MGHSVRNMDLEVSLYPPPLLIRQCDVGRLLGLSGYLLPFPSPVKWADPSSSATGLL